MASSLMAHPAQLAAAQPSMAATTRADKPERHHAGAARDAGQGAQRQCRAGGPDCQARHAGGRPGHPAQYPPQRCTKKCTVCFQGPLTLRCHASSNMHVHAQQADVWRTDAGGCACGCGVTGSWRCVYVAAVRAREQHSAGARFRAVACARHAGSNPRHCGPQQLHLRCTVGLLPSASSWL